jgi:hypothetical protein
MSKLGKSFRKSKVQEIKTVYNECQITKKILLPITAMGQNLLSTLESTISEIVCGKCIVDGYVKPGSIQIISHTCGTLKKSKVLFDVVFKCMVCFPVSGMKLKCIVKNATKAGIRAESAEDDGNPSPFILFVARDHSFTSDVFNTMKIGQEFVAKVIDKRFELNDTYVSIIAEIDKSYEREKEREKAKSEFKPSINF